MSRYLLIQAFDPQEGEVVTPLHELASDLVQEGNEVSILLVDRGVLTPRSVSGVAALARAERTGIEVLVEESSMRAHGVAATEFPHGVHVASDATIADRITAAHRVIGERRQAMPEGTDPPQPAPGQRVGCDQPDALPNQKL